MQLSLCSLVDAPAVVEVVGEGGSHTLRHLVSAHNTFVRFTVIRWSSICLCRSCEHQRMESGI
jgi:hypothetical protein